MAKRLVKIAKELNVGVATIVDHLNENGFEIDNKPTAKVSDEMHAELLRAFESSISVKEQADKITLGYNKGKQEEPKEEPPKAEPEEKPASDETPADAEKEKKKSGASDDSDEKKDESSKEKEKTKKEDNGRQVKGPKVVGKIDLDKKKKEEEKKKKAAEEKKKKDLAEQKKKKAAEEKKKKQEREKEEKAEQENQKKAKEGQKEESESKNEESDSKKEGAAKTPKGIKTPPEGQAASDEEKDTGSAKDPEKEEEVIKTKSPTLKGLKVQGKIDLKKFDKKKKKKKQDSDDKPKRKRRRRKVVPNVKNKGKRRGKKGKGKGKGKEEPQEITQKEIEEKIKATMARISGGKKSRKSKSRKDSREKQREQEVQEQQQLEQEEEKKLEVTEFVSVSDLASLMDVNSTDIITTAMNLGVIVSINQRLDAEMIELIADEFDYEVEFISAEEQTEEDDVFDDDEEDLVPRSPIITVMGHVDHGKTSLLDYIRSENVASGEAGGITQHIGAYEVTSKEGKKVTFLDTPGHEAFTAMRARGAKVTDVAVIIIAADDRIMPQTKEAISHAEAAGVPMVFAINKIDKPGADPERIKNELAQMNYLVEDWGGKYQSQDISAINGEGVPELVEKITLEAEVLELQANPDREAVGVVLEASLDKGRGYTTNILILTGTLKIGDPIISGEHAGKVKAMYNERGERVKEVGPAQPALVLGLSGAPQAGERFKVTETEQEARQIATKRAQIVREQNTRASKRISLDEIGRRLALGTFKELNLIVKGDVDGSIEALSDSLIKLSQETVQVNVIHKAVGQIIESDVLLASASDAIIIGFQVRPSMNARKLAETEGVEIKSYSIIYKAIEEIKLAIEGMLEPTKEEKIVCQVEVRDIFKISKVGTIAGCYVQEGKITRNTKIRVIRDGIVIYPTKEGVVGEIDSLKRYKDDVKEVKNGMECGLSVKNFNDIKVGDMIEGYEIIEIKQTLE
ncbi:MAG: translation initiation factor IF-2 [Bacteroidetes bacterium]|jgi:translation initiation factor IF-2|nr:translation initiation factor IF-2 [Bacteroidota bacterium]